jgi:uncharacterized protein YaiL (DUF2058 family)
METQTLTLKDIKELIEGLDNVLEQLSAVRFYFIDNKFIKNCDKDEKEYLEQIINGKLEENINNIFIISDEYVVEKIPIKEDNLKETFTKIVNNLKMF